MQTVDWFSDKHSKQLSERKSEIGNLNPEEKSNLKDLSISITTLKNTKNIFKMFYIKLATHKFDWPSQE